MTKLKLNINKNKVQQILELEDHETLVVSEETESSSKNNKQTEKELKRNLSPKIKLFKEWKQILEKRFSKAFPKKQSAILKIGIREDIIQELKISKTKAKIFLQWYTSTSCYLKQHKEGAPRCDLQGNIVEYVTKEQEIAKLAKFRKIKKDLSKALLL